MFKFKEGENFNHRNTSSISRIKLKLHFVHNVETDAEIGQKGFFCKGLITSSNNTSDSAISIIRLIELDLLPSLKILSMLCFGSLPLTSSEAQNSLALHNFIGVVGPLTDKMANEGEIALIEAKHHLI